MPIGRSLGGIMILVAFVLGVILALGLFQWETGARAQEALLHPAPTARPPLATAAATVPASSTAAPAVAPTDTSTPAPTDTVAVAPVTSTPVVTQTNAQSTAQSIATVVPTPTMIPGLTPTVVPGLTATAVPATPTVASTGGSAALVAAGAQIFAANCNGCHPSANAGVGPALHGSSFTAHYPDNGPLELVIRGGRNGMPAFPASSLSDANLNAVVAYLRSLK